MTSETIAQNLYEDRKIPHYIVGMNHGPQMLYQLMFETKKKKVYASYPITSAKEGKIPQEEINEFIAKLKRYFIVFDPYTIREKKLHDLVIQQLSGPLPKSESIEVDGQIYHVDDLLRIILDINGQIITRDERLINKVDAVIAYRPSLSQGASYELTYAEMTGKNIITYHPQKDDSSPFAFKAGILRKDLTSFYQEVEEFATKVT
jgi:nucleoside 2-deoxyribosyltransferase